jgi:peptide/nickel transport system permease protein
LLRFVVRRLLLLIPILFGVSVLIFVWVHNLPGSTAQAILGEKATPQAIRAFNEAYGLDKPLWVQYAEFLKRALRLDFGVSVQTQQPVWDEINRRFPATIELSVAALVFAVSIGVPLGYLAARKYGTWPDNALVSGSLVGVVIPVFVLGYILKYVFAVKLGWLPDSGRQDTRLDVAHPTGFYVLDGLLVGNIGASWDALKHLILPGIALGTIPLAIITRITRASVLDVVNEDYVRTAEAKGLARGVIRQRHIMRNALLPVVTVIGLQTGLLLSGAILTETVFAIPGMGSFMKDAIFKHDYSTIEGFVLFSSVLYVLINLLVDISYGVLDPRVRVR